MKNTVTNVINYLEEKEIKYTHFPAEGELTRDVIQVLYTGEHGNSLRFAFFFDEDGESVNLKCFDIAKANAEKLMNMYVTLNTINCDYRWIKLYLNEENEIVASTDAIIDPETAGAECFELLLHLLSILDDVYPNIMKSLWA